MRISRSFILLTALTVLSTVVSSCDRVRSLWHETVMVYDTTYAPRADSLVVVAKDSVVLKEHSAAMIVVDKEKMTLSVLGFRSDTLMCVPMCCGHQFGDKQTVADDRTPEGVFKVRRIEDSEKWKHTRVDGEIEYGSYGPVFIRLEYPPMYRIGIHGTNLPESIGKRDSEGCVRLRNEDILRLSKLAYVGMPVVIIPGKQDIEENAAYLSSK